MRTFPGPIIESSEVIVSIEKTMRKLSVLLEKHFSFNLKRYIDAWVNREQLRTRLQYSGWQMRVWHIFENGLRFHQGNVQGAKIAALDFLTDDDQHLDLESRIRNVQCQPCDIGRRTGVALRVLEYLRWSLLAEVWCKSSLNWTFYFDNNIHKRAR